MVRRDWVLKRNCSIAPRQLASVYAVLCAVSLAVAIYFTAHGAWYVLGFAMLELLAVGFAFLHFGRHATDREHIAIADDTLLVELFEAERARRFRLDARWARVDSSDVRHGLIGLEAGGARVEVGRF